MIWEAVMKDGKVIKEYDCGNLSPFEVMDRTQLDTFRITETGNEVALPFNGDSGLLTLPHLNIEKMQTMPDGAKIEFAYDKKLQKFRMESESLKYITSLILREPETYNFIEFNQDGKFRINCQDFYVGFETNDGEDICFTHNGPYDDLIHYKRGATDFLIQQNKPVKKMESTVAYAIGYNHKHVSSKANFENKLTVTYDLMNRCISLDMLNTSDVNISGKLYLVLGDKKSYCPVDLVAGQAMQTKRNLVILM